MSHEIGVDWSLWYVWVPAVIMSAYNLFFMYTLDAPVSLGGRISRGLAYMACTAGLFVSLRTEDLPINFPIGLASYYLLLASFCALTTQYHFECRKKKAAVAHVERALGIPPTPAPGASTTEKVVTAIVGKPSTLRREDHLWQGSENNIHRGI